MIIKNVDNMLVSVPDIKAEHTGKPHKGQNGMTVAELNSVQSCFFNISEGNTKTGPAWNYNLPIEYSCGHLCECYKKKTCYACEGCYNFFCNQIKYTENLAYILNHTDEQVLDTFQFAINSNDKIELFRFFTCGDIYNMRFFNIMVQLAKRNPRIKFWAYTKKYNIVNLWIKTHGNLPKNLTIIFSHWLNEDGSYYPMPNPYNLPTSEFIPAGMEYLAEKVTHVCPCSDPTVIATCATCENPCHGLQPGESMALLEHSTQRTKARDKALKIAKNAIKATAKTLKNILKN